MTQYDITVIGCGKMGSALIHGWISAKLLKRAQILDPYDIDESLSSHPDLFHVKLMESLSWDKTELVVLAVKPQLMGDICPNLKKILPANIPVLSIAAGKSTAYFQEHLTKNTPIIRSMPNTPAAIGKGISALYATHNVNDTHKTIASDLLNAVGESLWLDDEALMDAVTAVSGSGPAYVFYMMEAMAKAGEKVGLPANQAMKLARQTVIGAAALADEAHDTPASKLRQNVTSPGGTTEAALNILMQGDFQDTLTTAIEAAFKRGKDLAD